MGHALNWEKSVKEERPAVIRLLKELTAENRLVPSRTKMIAKLAIETLQVMEEQLAIRDREIALLRTELTKLRGPTRR